MPAFEAEAEVYPQLPGGKALFAAVDRIGKTKNFDVLGMLTKVHSFG
jgi:hypothetical protein